MSGLILHHYAMSPYAEKIRLCLGLKDVAWRSVDTPMVMPKPDHVELTGGYRRVPVLQVGADIYCDTACIARELDRRLPQPPLYPPGQETVAHRRYCEPSKPRLADYHVRGNRPGRAGRATGQLAIRAGLQGVALHCIEPLGHPPLGKDILLLDVVLGEHALAELYAPSVGVP